MPAWLRGHRRARAPIELERGGGSKRGEVVTRDQRWQECTGSLVHSAHHEEKFVADDRIDF